jgi:uncharacterized protein YkwD
MYRALRSAAAVSLLLASLAGAQDPQPTASRTSSAGASSNGNEEQSARDAKPTLHAVERQVLEQTNRERQRRGLRPLRLDLGLLASARRHTAWMTRSRRLRHTSAPVAENIAMGQRTPPEAMRSWMNSPGHRANILNASYTRIGVGAYRTADGTVFWCQQFQR